VSTRYLLRGARGYVAGIHGTDWTANPLHAHQWVTAEAAHLAARRWHQTNNEHLSVVVRSTAYPYTTAAS
jgi:hypothetical protein